MSTLSTSFQNKNDYLTEEALKIIQEQYRRRYNKNFPQILEPKIKNFLERFGLTAVLMQLGNTSERELQKYFTEDDKQTFEFISKVLDGEQVTEEEHNEENAEEHNEENVEEHNEENVEEHNEEEHNEEEHNEEEHNEEEDAEEHNEQWIRQKRELIRFKNSVPELEEKLLSTIEMYLHQLNQFEDEPCIEHEKIMDKLRQLLENYSDELNEEIQDMIIRHGYRCGAKNSRNLREGYIQLGVFDEKELE